MERTKDSWATEERFIRMSEIDPLIRKDPLVVKWVEIRNGLYDKYRKEEAKRKELRLRVVKQLVEASRHFNQMLTKPETRTFLEEGDIKREPLEIMDENTEREEERREVAVITLMSSDDEGKPTEKKKEGEEKKDPREGNKEGEKRKKRTPKARKSGIKVVRSEKPRNPVVVLDRREACASEKENEREPRGTEREKEIRRAEKETERRCAKNVSYTQNEYSDVSIEEEEKPSVKHPSTRAKFRKAYRRTMEEKRRSGMKEKETVTSKKKKTENREEQTEASEDEMTVVYSDYVEEVNQEWENAMEWNGRQEKDTVSSSEEAYEAATKLMYAELYEEAENEKGQNNNKEQNNNEQETEEIKRTNKTMELPPPAVTYAVDLSNPDVDPRAYVLLNHPQAEVEQKDEAPGIVFIQVPHTEER